MTDVNRALTPGPVVRTATYDQRVPDDPEMAELTLLMWAMVGFAALVTIALVALLATAWWFSSGRVFVDFGRARRAGDLWAPFLRDADGHWGRLVSSSRQSAFRAEARGSDTELWLRWGPLLGLHGALTALLVGVPGWAVVTLARHTWGS